jgi:hypothetical protein
MWPFLIEVRGPSFCGIDLVPFCLGLDADQPHADLNARRDRLRGDGNLKTVAPGPIAPESS